MIISTGGMIFRTLTLDNLLDKRHNAIKRLMACISASLITVGRFTTGVGKHKPSHCRHLRPPYLIGEAPLRPSPTCSPTSMVKSISPPEVSLMSMMMDGSTSWIWCRSLTALVNPLQTPTAMEQLISLIWSLLHSSLANSIVGLRHTEYAYTLTQMVTAHGAPINPR